MSTKLRLFLPLGISLIAIGFHEFVKVRTPSGGISNQTFHLASKIDTANKAYDENGDYTGTAGTVVAAIDLLEDAVANCTLPASSLPGIDALRDMANQNRICKEAGRSGPARSHYGKTNLRDDDPGTDPGPTPGEAGAPQVDNVANDDAPSINLNPDRVPKYEDVSLGDIALLAGTLYHESQHVLDGVGSNAERHAEIYWIQIQMLCCILDYIQNSPLYTQAEKDDAENQICGNIEVVYIPKYHQLGGDEDITNCCTGATVSPPPSGTTPGSGNPPFAPLALTDFGPDHWEVVTPIDLFDAWLNVVDNELNVLRRNGDSWTLSLASVISGGDFEVRAMSGGLGTDISLFGEDPTSGESVLLQGTIGWNGSAPILGAFSEIYRGVDFGDVTAIANLTYAHGKYIAWDYTFATIRWIDTSGNVGTVTDYVAFPDLAGKRGMAAGFTVDFDTQAINGYSYAFTDRPGTENDHADRNDTSYFRLLDLDMDTVPDYQFPY